MKRNPKIFIATEARKPQSRQIPWGLILRTLLLLAIVAGIIYFFIGSQFFNIDNIEIQGTILVPENEIETSAEAEIARQTNILFFTTTGLEKRLKEDHSLIQAISVQKGIPDTIRIVIREREPELVWQSNKKEYLVDSTGYIFALSQEYREKSGRSDKYLPRIKDLYKLPIKLNQKVAAKDWVDFIKELDGLLIKETNLKVKRYTIKGTTFDLAAVTDRGKIYFDTGRSAKEQVGYLETAFDSIKKKRLQYLDLRVKGWVYYQ